MCYYYYTIHAVVHMDSSIISTNVFIEDGYMIFECNVSEADSESDLQGCIILTHDRDDHSILHVRVIEKENPVLKLEVESGSKYSFAVFDWRMTTGMIGSNTLLKGTLCFDTHNTSTDAGGTVNIKNGIMYVNNWFINVAYGLCIVHLLL